MLKLGYNEATCKENSSVEKDLILCEKYGYDYIELRLDMLKEYFKTHTIDGLRLSLKHTILSLLHLIQSKISTSAQKKSGRNLLSFLHLHVRQHRLSAIRILL